MAFDPNARLFTTIGNYRQKGSDVEYNGQTYHWSKHHEWEKFIGPAAAHDAAIRAGDDAG
jgi:hypothetical protein